MRKVLAVARTEYWAAVKSKAFLAGLVAMPILMGGGLLMQFLMKDTVDIADRHCAIVDPTGEFFPVLEKRNATRSEVEIFEDGSDGAGRVQKRPRFVLEQFTPGPEERPDLTLSERVRKGELFAFLMIDEDVLSGAPTAHRNSLAYHTQTPTYSELSRWLERIINEELFARRCAALDLDPAVVKRLQRRVPVLSLGLAGVDAAGNVEEAVEESKLRTLAVPAVSLMLLFMLIMTSAPALLNQVLEEKMQRISEVLVSSVSPFELLLGKLLGSVGVSMTLAVLYLSAAAYLTYHFEVADQISPTLYLWFLVFLALAMFMYGSMFSAVGAACSEIRDAQSLMFPVLMVIMIPFFCFGVVLDDPSSPFSRTVSLIPIATPLLLMLRMGVPPGPAAWEVVTGVILCGACTVFCVWAAGKIFRVGILAQGQAPSLGRLLRWVLSK